MVSKAVTIEDLTKVASAETQIQTPDYAMSNSWDNRDLLSALRDNRSTIFKMCDKCGKQERTLEAIYYHTISGVTERINVPGLFGLRNHQPDKLITIQNTKFVSECKKVIEGREYGYWHAIIQGVIYRHQGAQYPIVCTVFDWGRKAGEQLTEHERKFLGEWILKEIYFVRISFSQDYFIEHNLNSNWEEIR